MFAVSCSKEPVVQPPPYDDSYDLIIPPGFSQMLIPEDNLLTNARVLLGKQLFFDKRLSRDFSMSCASCHHPQLAFSEQLPISVGVNGTVGMRNSPTLANVGYLTALFAEGGIPSLELQAIAPIIEEHELNLDFLTLIERLESDEQYRRLFEIAYQSPPTALTIVKAISSFERTLISGNSTYDQYTFQGNLNALTESQIRGKNLFFSDELACSSCHSGFLFTNQSKQNIGLYDVYQDEGLARLTSNPDDIGKFKVPTLRNIEVTAPYMHNGSLATLEEVVEHFNTGGVGHANQSDLVKPLNLNEQEKQDLVNFLKSLTDHTFLNNPEFQ
jgi:cytochrome c peroxidase